MYFESMTRVNDFCRNVQLFYAAEPRAQQISYGGALCTYVGVHYYRVALPRQRL